LQGPGIGLKEVPSGKDLIAEMVDNAEFMDELKKKQAERDGVFVAHEQKLVYDRKSLFFIDADWQFRKAVVWLISWNWFERFITLVILVNSVMLAMIDYGDRIYGPTYVSTRNNQLAKVDLVFSCIFIAEATLKIIGMGFVVHRHSYLRDPWHWLDFFVVSVSIVNFLPNVNSPGLKAMRTFRILRPLRTINAIP
jgi:hypothetical protein